MSLIVIIEDQRESARLAERILRRAGHTVVLAEDGEGGMEAVLVQSPDLVLVDLGLPDIDGQTIVALLKQQPELASVPILAFTAYPEASAREMARAYGCDGVIVKPIDTRTFADQVGEFLRARAEQ
jgi:two-component system cell cycle response regulator DivK